MHRNERSPKKDRAGAKKSSPNCGVSVDLEWVLEQLRIATGWVPDLGGMSLGTPGEYVGDVSYMGYEAGSFGVRHLFSQIMSKYDDQDKASNASKTSKALAKFREAELLCAETNLRVSKYFCGFLPENPDVARALLLARRKIWSLLGTFDWNDVIAAGDLTGGASAKLPRELGFPAYKYSRKLESTPENLPAVMALATLIPSWNATSDDLSHIDICEGNRLNCVPKNYKVHRLIAMEPFGNMYLQKGFGAVLRRRLLAVGNDLRNQQPNQEWARMGSSSGLIATVDLSMASDTVSETLVEWMLPPDWVEAMAVCRSRSGVLPSGEKVLYRKWSSMGNAYTFELETLLFWGIVQGVCDVVGCDGRFTRVYGDDIVIPSRAVPLLFQVLEEGGFKPNPDKSFWDGPFRESCGKHYYHGRDVTPFYIIAPVKRLSDLFLLANNLERWRRRMEGILPDSVCDKLFGLVRRIRAFAPSHWRRPRIPDGKGDGAFIGTFDECLPSRPRGEFLWWDGWSIEVLTQRFKLRDVEEPDGEWLEMSTKSCRGMTFKGFVEASCRALESKRTSELLVDSSADTPAAKLKCWQIQMSDPDYPVYWENWEVATDGTASPVNKRCEQWVIQPIYVTQFS